MGYREGRHLSTVRILCLLVEHGVDTPSGFEELAPGTLAASTLDRHLHRLGYDHGRMTRQPPAVRCQAEHANALWHFDMSPSDLKQLKAPPWIDPERQGAPTLMLFSIVDDRSGVAYHNTAASTARMSRPHCASCSTPCHRKPGLEDAGGDPFQGIPSALYLDNGPIAKSAVFKRVMEASVSR